MGRARADRGFVELTREFGHSVLGDDRALVDLSGREVRIRVDLHAGAAAVTVCTNDLTADYVHENSAYST